MPVLARISKKTWKQNTPLTCFNSLPAELRDKIWVYSLPDPRVVYLRRERQLTLRFIKYNGLRDTIQDLYRKTLTSQTNDEESKFVYWSFIRVPIISSVCRESRAVMERFYTKSFKTSKSPGIWIDFQKDALCLAHELYESTSSFYETFPEDIHRVEFLVLRGLRNQASEESVNLYHLFLHLLDVGKALQKCGSVELLILGDAQHRPNHTEQLCIVPEKSAEEYERLLREWVHPLSLEGEGWEPWPWAWPEIMCGVLKERCYHERSRWRDKRIWGKVYTWKMMFQNALPTFSFVR